MCKGYIYRHWIINDKGIEKSYIGLTTKDVEDRWGKNGSGYKPQKDSKPTKFWRAIEKYGWDGFNHDIIECIETETEQELINLLKEKEICYIEQYNSYYNGYNSTLGGDGVIIPQKELEKRRIKKLLPKEASSLNNLKLTKYERCSILEGINEMFNRLKEIDNEMKYETWQEMMKEYIIHNDEEFLKLNDDFSKYYKKVNKTFKVSVQRLINELYFTPVEVTWKYGFDSNNDRCLLTYEESINYRSYSGKRICSLDNSCANARVSHNGYAFAEFNNEFKVHQTIMLDTIPNFPCIWKRNACYNHNYVRFTEEPNSIFDYSCLYNYETLKEEIEKEEKAERLKEEETKRLEMEKRAKGRHENKNTIPKYKLSNGIYIVTYKDNYGRLVITTKEDYEEKFNANLFEVGIAY